MRILYSIQPLEKIAAACPARRQAAWLAELPPARQRALQRLADPLDRLRSLLALQLLKRGLRALGHTAVEPRGLTFSSRLKPSLPGGPAFSISHSRDLVTCALHPAGRIGIDVEYRRPGAAPALGRYLSPAEQQQIRTTADFHDLWARKEAVVKAAGDEGLAAISRVTLGAAGATLDTANWHLTRLELAADYSAWLATDAPCAAPLIETVDFLDV